MPLTIGWTRDSRDSALVPTAGRYMRVNLDYGAARRRASTCASNLQGQQYIADHARRSRSASTPRSATARGWAAGRTRSSRTSTAAAWARCAASTRARSARSTSTGAFIGGNRRFNINNELYLPVPGAGADRTLRIFVYVDAGNVWGENEKVTLRQPARLGRRWASAGSRRSAR